MYLTVTMGVVAAIGVIAVICAGYATAWEWMTPGAPLTFRMINPIVMIGLLTLLVALIASLWRRL